MSAPPPEAEARDAQVVLYGPIYSAYVRVARIVLAEKGVPYRHEPVDIFAPEGPGAAYLVRHPFGRAPALQHGDFALYETAAITRYVDEAFAGPPLQPAEARARARMTQIIHMIDSYGYWPWVRVIFVQRVEGPRRGGPDEAAIAEALPRAGLALDALAELMGAGPWLAGADFSLADAQAGPMIDYLIQAPEGRRLIEQRPALADWWVRLYRRPSLPATRCLVNEMRRAAWSTRWTRPADPPG